MVSLVLDGTIHRIFSLGLCIEHFPAAPSPGTELLGSVTVPR